nr:MAG TPA: hypothetical protein [Caudoviricetes sp.]
MCGVFERCKQGSYDEQGGAIDAALRYFDTGTDPSTPRPSTDPVGSTQAALCIRPPCLCAVC